MKKLSLFIFGFIFILLMSGCELTEKEIGSQIDHSLQTLKGEESVILKFDVQYGDSEHVLYDVYINHLKNYVGLVFEYGEEMNYRYIIKEEATEIDYYYEYHDGTFGKTEALGKTNYVYDKLSFNQYDVPSLTVSIDEIVSMIDENQISMNLITSEEEALKDLTVYEVTFQLDYFIEHNTSVLVGLYGDKVTEENFELLRGISQTITLGYAKNSNVLKYFAYNQENVLPVLPHDFSSVDVKVFVDSIGTEAETNMEALEASDVFPNENNVVDNS